MNKTETITPDRLTAPPAVPSVMKAAVYQGRDLVEMLSVPVPHTGRGELLVRIGACGVCATDIKKIELGLVPAPRIFGHEMAGTVVRIGRGVTRFALGDRVVVHHHVPCRSCFYCQRKLYSQCELYRRTGTTAGFEPAGGGFAEYVRVMDWIVEAGTVKIPDGVTFEEATFLEPLNTCLKALQTAELEPGEVVLIAGQGPIGLLLTQAAVCEGCTVVGLDPMESRLCVARELGATVALSPTVQSVDEVLAGITEGRGADLVIVATAAHDAVLAAQKHVRRGGRVLLFAQTVPAEMISVDASRVCMEEKKLIGSYSSSVELQEEAARLIFERKIDAARLITDRLPLSRLLDGIHIASHPSGDSLKVVINP